jgi:diguanylate cyclase (GGDEF)-like protein
MSELVDRLAELTGFRDRDTLDVTLVVALKDLLRPLSVAIHRRIGEPGDERWLTRARLGADDAVATADAAWADLASLPPLAQFPVRHEAMRRQCLVQVSGDTHLSVFPLATDSDVVGVLEIASRAELSVEEQRLVASILRIFRNFQGLLDYSERDTLTGLLNRKTFDESFLKATAEPQTAAVPSSDARKSTGPSGAHWLGVIDIDHFKLVNDNHGHLIGDEVLLLLGRLMRASFRYHDRLYRFGGEEFVVLMRCDSSGDAAVAFERLRRNTERFAFPQVGTITVSVGFSEVKSGDTPSAAFERADRAVYYAKGHGRNQVRSHADLVASGELVDSAIVGDVELF